MDINFKCPHCDQELTADDSGVGSEIECPSCSQPFAIPAPPAPAPGSEPPPPPAAAPEKKSYAVPQHDKASEPAPAIEKAHKPLSAAAKETDKQLRVRSIRRSDCVEVGKDHFDEKVTEILGKIGETNIVSINTFNYTHLDLATRQYIEDFGLLIVYKG